MSINATGNGDWFNATPGSCVGCAAPPKLLRRRGSSRPGRRAVCAAAGGDTRAVCAGGGVPGRLRRRRSPSRRRRCASRVRRGWCASRPQFVNRGVPVACEAVVPALACGSTVPSPRWEPASPALVGGPERSTRYRSLSSQWPGCPVVFACQGWRFASVVESLCSTKWALSRPPCRQTTEVGWRRHLAVKGNRPLFGGGAARFAGEAPPGARERWRRGRGKGGAGARERRRHRVENVALQGKVSREGLPRRKCRSLGGERRSKCPIKVPPTPAEHAALGQI